MISQRSVAGAVSHEAMRLALALALVLLGCSSGVTQAGGTPELGGGRRWLHPPPKPGSSIAASRMCSCRSCDPVGCCQGPDDDPADKATCDSYDFTSKGCGMAVQSCASRCFQHVWRVKVEQGCDANRPSECC